MLLGCSMDSATTRASAHGRIVMVRGPQVVIFHDGLMVLRGIRGRRRVGARRTAPICSSDAIHIHITIQICTQVRKKKNYSHNHKITRYTLIRHLRVFSPHWFCCHVRIRAHILVHHIRHLLLLFLNLCKHLEHATFLQGSSSVLWLNLCIAHQFSRTHPANNTKTQSVCHAWCTSQNGIGKNPLRNATVLRLWL